MDHGHPFHCILTNRGQFLYYFFAPMFRCCLSKDLKDIVIFALVETSICSIFETQSEDTCSCFYLRMNHNLSPLNNRCNVLHTAPTLLGKCTRISPVGQRYHIQNSSELVWKLLWCHVTFSLACNYLTK